ncbi:MAG: M20/M25/M40 family metallo-hydrolase [Bdellovibrionaceae bacterium]|nr:M20/M25/M40 family metallo-hydrolase [Pseudobdellovibrionaceae bacterium]
MNADILNSIDSYWEKNIIPKLMEYIEIPAKSPSFDADWEKNGFIEKALQLAEKWVESRNIPGLKKEVLRAPGRTPLLLLDLPGTDLSYNVLMYGHLDKQPEMVGWSEGLSPWKAVRRGEKLYGRGGADDGYAVFASLCAVEHLIESQSARPNIKIAIELSEESGSEDLPFYFEKFSEKFGSPQLVVCLDSGAGNYEQFWTTTSLRGLVSGTLKVQVLNEGVHSGDASGVVPSSFRVARLLLDRIENRETGEILPEAFKTKIPNERLQQAEKASNVLKDQVYKKFPFTENMQPAHTSLVELVLNRTWRAALSITGAEGLPEIKKAGNVLRPSTTLKLSLRLPPTIEAKAAAAELKTILEKNPPYNASVEYHLEDAASGWNAPAMSPGLVQLLEEASLKYYAQPALAMGEGGSIPFMGMLGEKFPQAQFVITGVLGPNSNAHGPNEFIHLEYAKKLTGCIFHILSEYKKLKA